MKIFWSWQSDLNGKISRHFIKECLKEAAEEINSTISLDERVEIDHDTKGVLGSPPIADTILQKIIDSNLFVGDVTPIALADSGKKVMNPNVAIEMGYAISEKGDSGIITIMNTAFGCIEDLPFDLRHKKGPITYFLSIQSSKQEISNEKTKLVRIFKDTIKAYVSNVTAKDRGDEVSLDLNGPAIFFDAKKSLLRMSDGGWDTTNDKEIFVKMEKSYLYIKAIPRIEHYFSKADLQKFMYEAPHFKIYPMFARPDNTPVTNKYGSIIFHFDAQDKSRITDFTQLFKNGVIIGLTNSFLYYSKNTIPLINLKNKMEKILEESICLLKNLNQNSDLDIDIEIGLINRDNCKIILPNPDGGRVYHGSARGPLEDEMYVLNRKINTQDVGKIDAIIKEFILLLIDDLGLDFDYEHHVWN